MKLLTTHGDAHTGVTQYIASFVTGNEILNFENVESTHNTCCVKTVSGRGQQISGTLKWPDPLRTGLLQLFKHNAGSLESKRNVIN